MKSTTVKWIGAATLLGATMIAGSLARAEDGAEPEDGGGHGTKPPVAARGTGAVGGTVTDEAGAVKDAIVRIGSTLSATGEDGAFGFTGIRAGTVAVLAQAEGHRSAVKRVDVSADAPASITFLLMKIPAPAPGKGTIHGHVVSEGSGDPVEGAEVTAGDITTKTDEAGEFVIPDADPGETEVTVTHDGDTEQEDVNVAPDEVTDVNVEAGKTDDAESGDDSSGESGGETGGDTGETGGDPGTGETPPPAVVGTMSGTVTSTEGVPVVKAVVRVSAGDDLAWVTKTDADGKYAFAAIPAGAVKVVVVKGGFQSAELDAAVAENANTVLDATLAPRVPNGGNSAGQASIGGTVYGDTLDADGNPVGVSGAIVMVRGIRVFTDADGRYELKGLPNGEFNVQVWNPGFRHTHKKVTLDAENPSATVDVTLHPRTSKDEADQGGDENVGDADGDGEVSVGDAVDALRAALGLTNPTAAAKARADVAPKKPNGDYGDDEIDVQDAVELLRHVAGLEPVFP